MNWKTMFKGAYITAIELAGKKPTMTIKTVQLEKLLDEKTSTEKDKGIVRFTEIDRGWVLCKTNAICLAAMFGEDTRGWHGKRVTLFATEVSVGKTKALGIRIAGSPDIPRNVQVEVKLPRKKAFHMTMAKTGGAPAQQRAAPPPPAPEPPPEDDAGRFDGLDEPPPDMQLPSP